MKQTDAPLFACRKPNKLPLSSVPPYHRGPKTINSQTDKPKKTKIKINHKAFFGDCGGRRSSSPHFIFPSFLDFYNFRHLQFLGAIAPRKMKTKTFYLIRSPRFLMKFLAIPNFLNYIKIAQSFHLLF
jgi:hypothetical protein